MTESRTKPAPKHLWIVGIVTLLWNLMGAFDYLMTQTRNESYMSQFTPEQLEFFYGFPTWVDATWALAVWGAVAGSIALLLRRRVAGPLFFVALLSLIATSIHNFGMKAGAALMGSGAVIFTVVIYLVAIGEIAYARFLCVRGITRW